MDRKTVANQAFSILELATPDISYPLFAAAFMAPLTDSLKSVSLGSDFVLFLVSRTQSGKSTLAGLYQSFFGNFDKNHFPANYRMTASSLERTAYLLKDVLMVVDDYYPAQAASEKSHLKQLAQLLARLYGDGAGRARMDGSGKLHQTYEPRGFAISTGEERPEIGESGQARFVFLDVNRDKVRYEDAEDYAINKKHYLAQFMVMYLTWVAANRERIPVIFSETYIESSKAQWVGEGANLEERRLHMRLSASYVARRMGIGVKRLHRLEQGEPVKQAFLLRKSYENVLAYQEEVLKNEQLAAEVAKLRSRLQQNNVIVEVKGSSLVHSWRSDHTAVKKRSVI